MSSEHEEILKDVTIVVRSLITSIKPPVSLQCIERDYMKVENAPIPYRSLGYRNTLALLEKTNAFNFQKVGTQVSERHEEVATSHNAQISQLFTCLLPPFLSLSQSLSLVV